MSQRWMMAAAATKQARGRDDDGVLAGCLRGNGRRHVIMDRFPVFGVCFDFEHSPRTCSATVTIFIVLICVFNCFVLKSLLIQGMFYFNTR